MFYDFDVIILKIKNEYSKNYFNAFLIEKHF